MSDIIRQLEAEQMQGKQIPTFARATPSRCRSRSGKAIAKRLQAFEGVVIAKRNRGLNSSFTVRKVAHGEGVERVFQTYSPIIDSITVKRKGAVRRAKLYYLRDLSGKAARIKEKLVASSGNGSQAD